MDDIFDDTEQVVERCYCCDNWVRRTATKLVRVGERENETRWCVGCISGVDSYTLYLQDPDREIEPFDPDK